jgi:hypothetical protein
MWMNLEMILSTGPTKEHDDFLSIAALRHGVSLSEIVLAALVFWMHDAEAPASSIASASCYRRSKNVLILAIVESELKLREVQRQILLADMMVRSNHATLEQAPKVIDIRGMDFAAHVFTDRMGYGFVLVTADTQVAIAGVVIGRDQINLIAHGLAHKTTECARICMLDHLADHVAFTGDRSDNRSFAAAESALAAFLIPVAILVFPAHVGLIYFDDTHKLLKVRVMHRGTQAMTHEPSRSIRAASDHSMNLECTDALFAGQHEVQNLEPDQKRIISILENRARDEREAIRMRTALVAFPSPRTLSLIYPLVVATWAFHAIRPTMLHQIALAGIFVWKEPIKLGEGHLPDKLWFTCFYFLVHMSEISKINGSRQVRHNCQFEKILHHDRFAFHAADLGDFH